MTTGYQIGGHVLNRAGGHLLESGHLFPLDSAPCQSGARALCSILGFFGPGSEKSKPTACLLGGLSKPWASTSNIVALDWFITVGADGTGETPPLRHAAGRFRFGVQRARCGWIACWCPGLRPPCQLVVVEGRRDHDHHGRLVVAHPPLRSKCWTDSLSAQHFTRTGIAILRSSRRPRGAPQRYGEPSPTRYEVVRNRTCPVVDTRAL